MSASISRRSEAQAAAFDVAAMPVVRAVAMGIFPLLLVGFAAVYAADRRAYLRLLGEDGIVEYATVLFLLVAAGLALAKARRVQSRERSCRWFYVAFCAFCVFAAVEEVSWGQRIVHFASPEFFVKHARQRETNVHNLFEGTTKLTTRDCAAVVFVIYGIALPIAFARVPRVRALVDRLGVVAPPVFLVPGFVFSTVLQVDRPTGYEEEIGELFFSLCAVLFMLAALVEPARVSRPDRVQDNARP